ncbi:MAG: TMEM175 family protein [Actinomycetota bacterium]
METNRLEAFSDGVFAIAITLLMVLAEHLAEPASDDATVAALFYSGTFTITAIFYNVLSVATARGSRNLLGQRLVVTPAMSRG